MDKLVEQIIPILLGLLTTGIVATYHGRVDKERNMTEKVYIIVSK